MTVVLFARRGRLPSIDQVLLPLGVEVNATGGPVTATAIATSDSGIETRKSRRSAPVREYLASFGPEYVEAIVALFTAGLGPRYGFMALDPTDYQFTDELLEKTYRNGHTFCQLRKSYSRTGYFTNAAVRTVYREILLPVPAELDVTVDDTPVELDTDYKLISGGRLVFQHQTITGDVVASGQFFVPVRPSEDKLELTMHVQDLNSIQQWPLREILPDGPP